MDHSHVILFAILFTDIALAIAAMLLVEGGRLARNVRGNTWQDPLRIDSIVAYGGEGNGLHKRQL